MGEQPEELISTEIRLNPTGGSSVAGTVSRYIINFKTVSFISASSYLRITLPEKIGFKSADNPYCTFLPVLGRTPAGTMVCTYLNGQIFMRGLSSNLAQGQVVSLTVEVINPDITIIKPLWKVEILRDKTQYIYNSKNNLAGTDVTAGLLTNIVFSPVDATARISKGKREEMLLSFQNKNQILEGGMIEIEIPTSFSLIDEELFGKPTTFYVQSGLFSVSDSEKIDLDYDPLTSLLKITGFKTILPSTTISIAMLLKLPNQNGYSDSLRVSTYRNSTMKSTLIDEESKLIVVNVENLESEISSDYILLDNVARGTGSTDISFKVKSSVDIDGTIKFKFRSLTIAAGTWARKVLSGSTYIYSNLPCSVSGSTVTITVTSLPIDSGVTAEIKLTGILKLPSVAKNYYIDSVGTNSGGTVVFSYLQKVSFVSRVTTTISTNTIPKETNTKTLLYLAFTYQDLIPISSLSPDPAVSNSELRLYIEGIGSVYVKKDLSYGVLVPTIIPCKGTKGFLPNIGTQIQWKVYPGVSPYIEVLNYKLIAASTPIEIVIPNFTNPSGDYRVNLRILNSLNEVYNEIANGLVDVNIDVPLTYTTEPSPEENPELWYTIDNRRVSLSFILSFNLNLKADVVAGEKILLSLPFYDSGFIQNTNAIVCRINGVSVTNVAFKGVDLFLLDVPTTLNSASTVQNFITIEGLTWPRYITTNERVYVTIFSAAFTTNRVYTYARFTQPMPNYLTKYTLSIDKMKRGEANVVYTFTFRTKNDIPDGASLVIDIPTAYTLLGSTPPVVVEFPNFLNSINAPLSYFYSSAKVTIQNIGTYPKDKDFIVYLKGVKNPSTTDIMNSWVVSITYNGNLIEKMEDFTSFSLNELVTPGTITVNRAQSFPDNTLIKGDHYFSFTPRSSLKEGAKISIYFPSQYKILPSEPDCLISGTLNSFESCITDLTAIVLTLNSEFSSGTINMRINQISNPILGETDKFIIQTSYDGQIVDIVDTTTKIGKTIFISQSPVKIKMTNFLFDPQNEGEIATYSFAFNPNIALETSMEILIKFPPSFDAKIGYQVICFPVANLKGNVKCRFEDKAIYISGFDPITVTDDSPIILEIRGVVNPNKVVNGDSGTISIGVLFAGSSTFLSYVEEAGVIQTLDSPGWTFFQGITTSNLFSRFSSDYLFNFTVYDAIPNQDSGGMVIIDLPTDFSIVDGVID